MAEASGTYGSDPIFYVMGEGWYAELPERVLGPYPSRSVADTTLQLYKERAKFKSERYFHVAEHGWYVNTREGERGPFYSRREAERFVGELIENSRSRRLERW